MYEYINGKDKYIYDNYIVTFCKIKYIYEIYNKEKFILTNKELRVE